MAITCYHERGRLVKNTQERRVLEKTKEGQFEDTVNLPVQSSSKTKPKVSLGLLSKEVTSDLGDDYFWLTSTLLYFFPPGCHIDQVGPNIVEDNIDFLTLLPPPPKCWDGRCSSPCWSLWCRRWSSGLHAYHMSTLSVEAYIPGHR